MRTALQTWLVTMSLIWVLPAGALPEIQFSQVQKALNAGRFYKKKSFTGARGRNVAYLKFGANRGERGSVVIATGRTENGLYYLETAMDLLSQGFSPVYALDHRGQGFSARWLDDASKGDVEDFTDYQTDFARFLKIVQNDPHADPQRLFLIAHSMGAAIVMPQLMKNKPGVRAAVFTSPMFGLRAERAIKAALALVCGHKQSCTDYVPFGGPFSMSERQFDGNKWTHSKVRFALQNRLLNVFPQTQLGSPTVRWVREAVTANTKLRKQIQNSRLRVPVLIFQAQNDRVVDNDAQNTVCRNLGPSCHMAVIRGARHDILQETDARRTPVMTEITRHFSKYQ